MSKVLVYSFSLLVLTVSISGCLGFDDSEPGKTLVCSDMNFPTHEVIIDFVDYEFPIPEESNYQVNLVTVKNADLIYFEDATQVLVDGEIFDIRYEGAPFRENHTTFRVYHSSENGIQLFTNEGDVVCLIENPEISIMPVEKDRYCGTDSYRLENGSYEHSSPMCNYILTEHLDRTSTIRGQIEPLQITDDETNMFCSNLTAIINAQNSSFVGLNYTVANNWGHFGEGNTFTIYYNNQIDSYHKSYFLKELQEDKQGASIYSRGITNDQVFGCGISYVYIFEDENLTTEASLDRNLTKEDTWEVVANGCNFYRNNFLLGSSEMTISHGCEGFYKGINEDWYLEYQPEVDIDAILESQNMSKPSISLFFNNFTQAMITKNYSIWHSMLNDDLHVINSNITYSKHNLTETFFENFTNALGTIELENASRLDIEQSHWRLIFQHTSYNDSTFNWVFDPSNFYGWNVTSPIGESVLSQDRIYNSTGYGYDDIFVESINYTIMTWVAGPNTTPLLNEYLLTIVVDRDTDGNLSIVGIPDYNVMINR